MHSFYTFGCGREPGRGRGVGGGKGSDQVTMTMSWTLYSQTDTDHLSPSFAEHTRGKATLTHSFIFSVANQLFVIPGTEEWLCLTWQEFNQNHPKKHPLKSSFCGVYSSHCREHRLCRVLKHFFNSVKVGKKEIKRAGSVYSLPDTQAHTQAHNVVFYSLYWLFLHMWEPLLSV